jgi:flagellum-specific peptidoglycan hydrolase FlgJ
MLAREEMLHLIDRFSRPAAAAQAATGIPASVLMAQAMVESDFGVSAIAGTCKNFFSVPSGRINAYQEKPETESLKEFASDEEAFLAHAQLLEKFFPAQVGFIEGLRPARDRAKLLLMQLEESSYSARKKYWADVRRCLYRWNLERFDTLKIKEKKHEV